MPMIIQNFKNIDKAVNKKGKSKEIIETLEQLLASTSSAPLVTHISSPVDEPLNWCTNEEMFNISPTKTIEEATIIEDPYNFNELDEDDGTGPRQIGLNKYIHNWEDTLDDNIAEAAGFDSGYVNERQVTSISSLNIYSHTKKSTFLAGNITEQDLRSICKPLNK